MSDGVADNVAAKERLEILAAAIVEAADDAGIGLLVTTSRTLEPRTVYVSDAAVELFGYPRDELLEMPTFQLVAPEATDEIMAIAQKNMEGYVTPAFESVIVRRDGSHVPLEVAVSQVELAGEPVAVAFLSDVSHRREAQAALQHSEERFRTLIESAPEAVWITDGKQIVYANPAAIALFGYERLDEALGLPVIGFTHPDDRALVEERARAMLHGEELPPHEYRAFRRDGATLTLEVSSIGTEYKGRRALLSFGRDVTERKQFELQLLQADRLSALGMLAGGMAHAINNPLTYVLLNLEHLVRRLPSLIEDESYLGEAMVRLREAHHGAERVASVVRQMRTFSRTEGDGATDVDVRYVLDAAVGMVGNEVRHRGGLVTRYDDVPLVHANAARLEQVFLNLLVHAAQSLPEGEAAKGKVQLSVQQDGSGHVVVEVSDNGPGLEPGEIEHVFEPFPLRGREQSRLGLSVCYSIVETLGGSMEVDSKPGRGTTFRVTLPISQRERARPSSEPHLDSAPSSPSAARASVLVVDDDPGVGNALRIMLEDENDVTCVTDARQALRLLLGDSSFDIVFCDLMMPDVSGMDLFEALHLNRPGEEDKLVFMTGGAFTPEASRFLSTVKNLRIDKPFNLRELRRLVRRAVLGASPDEE